MTTYARSFLLGRRYCVYTTASQQCHNTLHKPHICRPHTRRGTKAGKRLIMPIRDVFSKDYNAVKFNCVNKQAGANFDNLKLPTVPEKKSAPDNAGCSRSIPSIVHLRDILHPIGTLSNKSTLHVNRDNLLKIKRVSDCKAAVEQHLRICCFNPK